MNVQNNDKITAQKFVYDTSYSTTGVVIDVDKDSIKIEDKYTKNVDYYRLEQDNFGNSYRVLSEREYKLIDKLTSNYFSKIARAYNKQFDTDLAPYVVDAFIMQDWFTKSVLWLDGLTPLQVAVKLKEMDMEGHRRTLGPM